ncbi:MAG: NAD-glutamate dehydrogenase, partial [Chlamydiae bacterium]|nr:NAD-glutamate dehydrogenase [Chlamydiota bacterium]
VPFPEIEGKLRIATIYFTEAVKKEGAPLEPEHQKQLVQFLQAKEPSRSKEHCEELVEKMDGFFLRKLPLDRQVIALEMFERAQTRDPCQYEVVYEEDWKERDVPSMHVVIAWKNVPKHNFLFRLARIVHQHGLVMRRVNATYTNPYDVDSIFLLSFGLHGKEGEAAWDSCDIADFLQEMVMLKYFGSVDAVAETFVKPGIIRGNLGNFLRTTMNFVHQVLVHVDPNLYAPDNIEEAICRHPELSVKLCEAFEQKFHPKQCDFAKYEELKEEFLALVEKLDTGHEYHDNRRKNIFHQCMNFVDFTLKCNFYRNNKTALAFRMDPAYLDHAPFEREKLFPELPYGIFFVKGMHFFGFHVRFRDLARGGLRTVFPQKKERMLAERNSVFTECYNLAYTQQKKNKDIPEGGSKAIIFLKPYERLASEKKILDHELKIAGLETEEREKRLESFVEEQKLEYLYQTQRSFITNFLAIINCDDEGKLLCKDVVDYWKRPEYIYLGPDENMHNSMIEWIAQMSRKVRYRPGGAFISGKPSVGINHKEYGVTSLGVNVYMDQVLRHFEIDPETETFTVKMTGGPDGDVAGNQILNLKRYYPNTAKIVALTDVSGTINDPKGLDLDALSQLFYDGLSIRHYPPEKLAIGGFLLDRETKREPTPYNTETLCWRNKEGKVVEDWVSGNEMNALFRNNVHQTKADIFIPCGGRPRTLSDVNYKDFLDNSGEPTAKAIVEGANLYLSPWARHYLEEAGVLIIKDSSANKGGVICSSFEILCGLSLPDELFLKNKDELVEQILERLRLAALNEAQLLLQSSQDSSKKMTELSDDVSKRINMFTDQMLAYLDGVELSTKPSDPLMQCFLTYCPAFLRDGYADELIKLIPANHKKAIIAAHIASKLVYTRGLKWFPTLVDILPIVLEDSSLFKPE